ncbi:hypothetical protein ACFL0I_01100 [Gemmatimonadota bacterium]
MTILTDWISSLRRVERGTSWALSAADEDWPSPGNYLSEAGPGSWTPEEVRLVRLVLGLQEDAPLFADVYGDLWDTDEMPSEGPERDLFRAWHDPWRDLLAAAGTVRVAPEELFHLSLTVERSAGMGDYWGLKAEALTPELAVILYAGDSYLTGPLSIPLGLADRRNLLPSTYLVLRSYGGQVMHEGAVDGDGTGPGFDTIDPSGMTPVQAYRLLLAFHMEGGEEVFEATDEELVAFDESSGVWPFEDFQGLLRIWPEPSN